jgi:hypothetical protein
MSADLNLKKTIVQSIAPQIFLDELSIVDASRNKDQEQMTKNVIRDDSQFGLSVPYMIINNTPIKIINYFKIDLTGKIPKFILNFKTSDDKFIFTSYPKDGDLLSVYVKSLSKEYKPLRVDFIINKVVAPISAPANISPGDTSGRSMGYNLSLIIEGEMYIPRLYRDVSRAFPNKTAHDVLLEIAADLKLGFASNEKNTSDAMSWICPNISLYEYIKDVSEGAWKDEEDFFDFWIDEFYNINLVNMNRQFNEENKVEIIRMPVNRLGDTKGAMGDDSVNYSELDFPLVLSNDPKYTGFPIFIKAFSLENNTGEINKTQGYFTNLQFYDDEIISDKPINKFFEYNIETVTTKNPTPRSLLYKGRMKETFYKEEIKGEWTGVQYFDNYHRNYHQAQLQNRINNRDSKKMILKVELDNYSPFVYRGQNISVSIVSKNSIGVIPGLKNTKDDDPLGGLLPSTLINHFLSGNYVIIGSEIEYKMGKMVHVLHLSKREWVLNSGVLSDPSPQETTL